MTIACVVPARYQSNRFPGKLLSQVGGRSVLESTLQAAQNSSCFDALYVATDDERIAKHVETLGIEVIWTSPLCPNGTERIREAILSHPPLQEASLILNLQGDHPCTQSSTLERLIQALRDHPKALVATPVVPIREESLWRSPHCVKVVFDQEKRALYFSRSPIPYGINLPPKAFGHLGLYAYRKEFFSLFHESSRTDLQSQEDLEQLKILERGYTIQTVEVDEVLLGIDTPEDLIRWEQHLARSKWEPSLPSIMG